MHGLTTDLYELRMAASNLVRGLAGPATFSLFARHLPRDRGFLVTAGLADALAFLETFEVTGADVEFLIRSGWDRKTAGALDGMRFTGSVRAVPEGRIVFADEPLLEVTAPIAEAQVVETALLNLISFSTTIATKAVRCRLAAGDAELFDFSLRRTQGLDAGMTVARCAAIAGFTATSNVEAAHRYGLAVAGTMAHSYVEAFGDEHEAFAAFAADFPENAVFLVDTYDTGRGVEAAIDTIRRAEVRGRTGIRLDSGNLARSAAEARVRLDAAGLPHARIVASGGLDEYGIGGLVAAHAPIDAYGIGTRMGVSADAPYLDSAYKLVEYDGRPVMKLSAGKMTLPGSKQVFRSGAVDVLGLREEPVPDGCEPLLVRVMRNGCPETDPSQDPVHPASPAAAIVAAGARLNRDLERLPEKAARLVGAVPLVAAHSAALRRLTEEVRRSLAPPRRGWPAPQVLPR